MEKNNKFFEHIQQNNIYNLISFIIILFLILIAFFSTIKVNLLTIEWLLKIDLSHPQDIILLVSGLLVPISIGIFISIFSGFLLGFYLANKKWIRAIESKRDMG